MPVSTRSKVMKQERNEQENTNLNLPLRNPHQGLKEKMRALTLLYEQQKRASFSLRNPNQSPKPEDQRFKAHLLDSCKKGDKFYRQDGKDSNFVEEETKENNVVEADRIFGVHSVPVKPSGVIRKLSMGNGARNVTEAEKMENLDASVSRILVFVRLRPMGKKERENGSRCCVKILNKRDVYLTEFTNENDYLRLKRLRVRHFTFDSSFPETTTQQEVYSTT